MKRFGFTAALALLATGCASGGPGDGLGLRKLSWFSYLNADDLKADCRAGAPERLRLVLNADYAEHVRTYDLAVDAATGAAELVVRALPAANAVDISADSQLGPWRGVRADRRLTPQQRADLQRRIAEAGAFGPPPVGLSLHSTEWFWLVSGCHQGQGFLTAYPLAGKTPTAPAFAPALAALDTTGIAFPDPAARERHFARLQPRNAQDIALTFTIRVGEHGLSGILPP